VQIDLVKGEEWEASKKITDEQIKSRSNKQKTLVNIDFRIYSKNDECFLIITELTYQGNHEQKIIKNPSKQDCLQFPNFKHLLWEKLKKFYKVHYFCPQCITIFGSNTNERCGDCNGKLTKIPKLKLTLIGETFLKSAFLTSLRLDELYTKRTKIENSAFDRVGIKKLHDLKEEFNQIVSNYSEEENSISEINPVSSSFENIEKKLTFLEEDKELVCQKCHNASINTKKIKLNLVKVSPEVLTFLISNLTVQCSNCKKEITIRYPSREMFDNLSDYNTILKSEISLNLHENLFCNECLKYYNNLEFCPTHKHPLQMQKTVIIRELRRFFFTRDLLSPNHL